MIFKEKFSIIIIRIILCISSYDDRQSLIVQIFGSSIVSEFLLL